MFVRQEVCPRFRLTPPRKNERSLDDNKRVSNIGNMSLKCKKLNLHILSVVTNSLVWDCCATGESRGGKFLDNLTDARASAREYEASIVGLLAVRQSFRTTSV